MSRWIDREYPKLATAKSGGDVGQDSGHRAKPLECMQRAGDVIYVPGLFAHATYTVQESVGVAVELDRTENYFLSALYAYRMRVKTELVGALQAWAQFGAAGGPAAAA